jgi:hypothetical protein
VELVSIHSQAREPTEACEVKQTNKHNPDFSISSFSKKKWRKTFLKKISEGDIKKIVTSFKK